MWHNIFIPRDVLYHILRCGLNYVLSEIIFVESPWKSFNLKLVFVKRERKLMVRARKKLSFETMWSTEKYSITKIKHYFICSHIFKVFYNCCINESLWNSYKVKYLQQENWMKIHNNHANFSFFWIYIFRLF